MVNMTLAVPQELHKIMKKHAEIRWSEVARQAIAKKASEIEKSEPWRKYALKHALEDWDAADELFEL